MRQLTLAVLLTLPCATLAAQGQRGEPATARYVRVEQAVWPRLDSIRVREARGSRADLIEQIVRAIGGTVAMDAALPALADTVSLARDRSARAALLAVVDGAPLVVLVDPALATVVVRAATRGVRRVRVLDERTQLPIVGVEVVATRVARAARTDRLGWASLGDLGASEARVLVRAIGYASVTVTVSPDSGRVVSLVPAPATLSQVVITPGSRRALESAIVVPQAVTREQTVARPQLGEDLLRALNRLPGVGANDYSSRFNVRGARAEEVLVLLDGMQLREPYHLKDLDGALSILDLHATGGVELVPGNATSEYGDRLTGVMSITPREPAPGETLRSAGLSLSWLRALAGSSTSDGRASWLVSARRGYLDLLFAITNADATFNAVYADAFARGVYRPTTRDELSLTMLGATDRLTNAAEQETPPFASRYGSAYGWMSWRHAGSRLTGQTVLGQSRVTRDRGATGGVGALAASRLDDERALDGTHLRSSWTIQVAPHLAVRAGTEVQWLGARYRYDRVRQTSLTIFGLERRADTLRARIDTAGHWTGVWIAPRVQLGPVVAEVGMRRDAWSWTGPAVWQPRANLAWQVDRATTVRAAAGDYAQAPGLDLLPVERGVTHWFAPERARHLGLGVDRQFGSAVSVRVDAYARQLTQVSPRFVDLGGDFDLVRDLRFTNRQVDAERGRARGVEFSVARAGTHRVDWTAWYARSEIADRIDGGWVPRGIDQPHAGAIDVGWRSADRRWRVSAALTVRTGWPITDVGVRVDSARVNGELRVAATPVFGAYNGTRLPTYVRLDGRVLREYQTRHGHWTVFADIFNALNRRNPLAYDAQVRSARPLVWQRVTTGYVPRLPSLGVTWER
ncbi:MAG: TonB-dependent receptor [Gemmatimonadaceae bacterium]|nr:TonB-dependent receptor [Gemmatimonadaceae bacterium]